MSCFHSLEFVLDACWINSIQGGLSSKFVQEWGSIPDCVDGASQTRADIYLQVYISHPQHRISASKLLHKIGSSHKATAFLVCLHPKISILQLHFPNSLSASFCSLSANSIRPVSPTHYIHSTPIPSCIDLPLPLSCCVPKASTRNAKPKYSFCLLSMLVIRCRPIVPQKPVSVLTKRCNATINSLSQLTSLWPTTS
jgi:hypothetical protein